MQIMWSDLNDLKCVKCVNYFSCLCLRTHLNEYPDMHKYREIMSPHPPLFLVTFSAKLSPFLFLGCSEAAKWLGRKGGNVAGRPSEVNYREVDLG